MPSMNVATTRASPIAPAATVEQVAIEHDQVRRLPDLDRPDLALEVVDAGRPGR